VVATSAEVARFLDRDPSRDRKKFANSTRARVNDSIPAPKVPMIYSGTITRAEIFGRGHPTRRDWLSLDMQQGARIRSRQNERERCLCATEGDVQTAPRI
jgi:hypothetical protein